MNSEMVFDPSLPEMDMDSFAEQDCGYSIYFHARAGKELKEELSPKMPEPLGKGFMIRGFR